MSPMSEVTRLQLQRGRKNRVNVYLDDEFAFGLSLDLAATLSRGQKLSEAEIASLKGEDDYHQARDRALHFLSYRPRSQREVAERLASQDFDEDVIERVLQRLIELQLLDDRVFAEWWVENRSQHRPRGARALMQELQQRGIPKQIIDEALVGLDELTMASELAIARAERYRGPDRRLFERRLGTWLQRRGFAWDAIREALGPAWNSLESEDPARYENRG